MQSLVDRIYLYIQSKGETVNSFSTRCGLANGTLNKARNTKAGLSSDTLEKILSANPDLSADWLFRGYQDDVLIAAEPPVYYQTKSPSVSELLRLLADAFQQIEERVVKLENR